MIDLVALIKDGSNRPQHSLVSLAEPGMDAAIARMYAERLDDAEGWGVYAWLDREALTELAQQIERHEDGQPVSAADLIATIKDLLDLPRDLPRQ